MLQKYSNSNYLKNFEIINKYNIKKNSDIFSINTIKFEIFLKKDNSDINFSYKIYLYMYILFNIFSFIHYQIIPSTNRTTSFSIKLEGLLSNKRKIESFLQYFVLEKKNILSFKSVTQLIIEKNNYVYLSLGFPLKEYIQLNSLKLQTISYLNMENEIIFLKFKLSKKFLTEFILEKTLNKFTHYFSFWKILIKKK